ncbi:hypothetical protein BpHYR1_009549 [Brachionus plicatilis]|uniref:Uncharacterized protein n=1 Tax=Brachionus plicatilis TaxID=10195 RepID=A0A3M7Q2T1_BRAPC|nr:hypothetical protein BpHYR1_009549 [Brachionus plicatilis]
MGLTSGLSEGSEMIWLNYSVILRLNELVSSFTTSFIQMANKKLVSLQHNGATTKRIKDISLKQMTKVEEEDSLGNKEVSDGFGTNLLMDRCIVNQLINKIDLIN